jgi:hypothetical protein
MSTCDPNTKFKGVNNIVQDLLLNILEANFKMYLDWAFLNIGGWFDVQKPLGTIYFNQNQHYKLVLVEDPAYEIGRVWQGIRKDWVWETNVDFQNNNPPIPITQVIINNASVIPKTNNFVVNYPLGRVIFNNPLPTNSLIELDYSYRFVQVHRSSESPWFNILQFSSFNTNNRDIQLSDQGEWSIGGNHRIQLPCIIIEPVSRSRSRPYEIGNSLLWLEQDVAFYVLAENKNDRNKILDILRLQQDATLELFDTNLLAQNDNYPLDYNGDIKNNALMYPDIIGLYPWRKCFMKNISLFEIDSPHPNLHQGMARATLEIIST